MLINVKFSLVLPSREINGGCPRHGHLIRGMHGCAWEACEAWESASSSLYGRLEDAQPLMQELTKLQVILEIWAKIDTAPSPMLPIPERVKRRGTSEQISIQTVTPS